MSYKNYSTPSTLRVFTDSFTVMDIAEPLASFDADQPAEKVAAQMDELGFSVVGLRQSGQVSGYVERTDLSGGLAGEFLRPFEPAAVLAASASFSATITALARSTSAVALNDSAEALSFSAGKHPCAFVEILGQVGGIVTSSDLQKPPLRMWLFGIITLIEMQVSEIIRANFPGDRWEKFISPGRIEKARKLQEERQRRGEDVALLDCLQIADKGQILLRDPELFSELHFQSKRRGQQTFKNLETLRNHLAHSQDILSANWEAIIRLTENLENLIDWLSDRKVYERDTPH